MRLKQTIIKFFFILPCLLIGGSNTYAQNINDYKKTTNKKTSQKKIKSYSKPLQISPADGEINGHGYVDLGLPSGTKWATYNIGAIEASDYGNYYAWGETDIKESYTWENYFDYDHKSPSGVVIYFKTFDCKNGRNWYKDYLPTTINDVACKMWGKPWRVPATQDIEELIKFCEWQNVTINGTSGFLIKGPSGKCLFLPKAGRKDRTQLKYKNENGYYWTSSLAASYMEGEILMIGFDRGMSILDRYFGASVRAVSK